MNEPKQVSIEMWGGPPAARLRELSEPARSQFQNWLRGQTVPVLTGVKVEDQDAFYLHDYRRWKSGLGQHGKGWF